ncbi:VTT domain-containing protein [Hahella sp. SMD15-11]|uniref:VTT domain-containing protein n=1 Tax=Thermohahella caldifontis TaxID=3142973 RepID=A0AB39V1Q2_9GAMM
MDGQVFLDWLNAHPDWITFAVAFLSLVESLAIAGMIVPGVVLLFGAAGLAGSAGIPVWEILVAGVVGALLGDGISFALGRIFHERIRTLWPLNRYPNLLDQGERFFHQHGGKSIVLGRFVGPLRAIMPLVAGMFGMPAGRFLLFNFISALGWAPVYLLPGYGVGLSVSDERTVPPGFYPTLISLVLLLGALAGLFSLLHWHVRPEGRFYNWLVRHARQWAVVRLWMRRMASYRHGYPEYPLPSLLLALSSLVAFALLALLVVHGHRIWILNQWIAGEVTVLQALGVRSAMAVITTLGDPAFLYLGFMAIVAGLWVTGRHWQAAVGVMLTGLMTHLSTSAMKQAFGIVRPDGGAVFHSGAFPSGHAVGATVLTGLLATFIARERPRRERWRIYLMAAPFPLLVGISRVVLGVHWMTDVAGGWLWGLFLVATFRVLFSPLDRRPVWPGTQGYRMVLAVAVLWLAYAVLRLPDTLHLYGAGITLPS